MGRVACALCASATAPCTRGYYVRALRIEFVYVLVLWCRYATVHDAEDRLAIADAPTLPAQAIGPGGCGGASSAARASASRRIVLRVCSASDRSDGDMRKSSCAHSL